jgi:Flp pilus assembly protein TadG
MLRVSVRRFIRDRRGSSAMIFGLSLIPIFFLTGMAMDFTSAAQKRTRLNAAADAAALAAVTPAMMIQSNSAALTAATNMFNAMAANITAASVNPPTITMSNAGLVRTVTVSYTATSTNTFPNVFALLTKTPETTWPVAGSATATSYSAPNINFYLLLDNSPSMDIAATTDGITTMNNNTTQQSGGCALACHETNPTAADVAGNPKVNGQVEDNYALANSLGVVTRIELMAQATSALMTTAADTEAANNATYQMAIYTFNGTGLSTVYAPNNAPSANLSAAGTAASGIDVLEVYSNNFLTASNQNEDTDTNFETAMTAVNNLMPNPGTGATNSTPQEVLFIVSDGVDDEVLASGTTCSKPLTGTRCQQPFNTSMCTTVKNRGIMIAVLYTEYLPLPLNSWYNEWIAPFQSTIGSNIQSCASPGLYFEVTTDSDITAAMQSLFQLAIATARLSQ